MCCDEGATSGDAPGAGTLESVGGAFFPGVDVDLSSFTAGADYRVFGTTITGFSGGSAGTLRDIIASGTTTMLEAEDEDGTTASGSHACDTIVAIVDVAPERGAREWNVIAGIGVFTGSFIIKL